MEKFEKINNSFLIANEKEFKRKVEVLRADGFDQLHILADFDKTLTKAFVDGVEIASLISVLRRENYITPDYPARAQALFDKYHSIEIDPNVSRKEKMPAMEEWWRAHFALLIESGLTRTDVQRAVRSQHLRLREGVSDFLISLNRNNIPMVIISASGLGKESIALYLQEQNLLTDNIYIVSNGFRWNEKGRAIAIEEPIIHTCNKDEAILENFSFYSQIAARENVLLLGDSLDDAAMTAGVGHKTILKIGFLNKKIEENREKFLETFDAVVIDDGRFEEVNKIIFEK